MPRNDVCTLQMRDTGVHVVCIVGKVGGSGKAVVAAAGRLGHGVVAGRFAQVANGRTWSRDEENVLIEEYARVGMCRVCIIRRPRAHTCMYVCTIDGAISTHIDTHEHMQSLTCT